MALSDEKHGLIRNEVLESLDMHYYRKIYVSAYSSRFFGIAIFILTPIWSNLVFLIIFLRVLFILGT